MRKTHIFIRAYFIGLFYIFLIGLFSQDTNTIIKIELPYKVYFESPCIEINECIDSIYQSSDTLFLLLHDNRYKLLFRENIKEDTNTAPYMWLMERFAIDKNEIKKYNIQIFIPSYYESYSMLVIQYAHYDYFFKQNKRSKYIYKYVETENLLYNIKYYRSTRRKWKHAHPVDNIDIRIKK
jgi:hypothetical protein